MSGRLTNCAGDRLARHPDDSKTGAVAYPRRELLLVEASVSGRVVLQRALAAQGFWVTGVADAQPALAALEEREFGYAVIGLGPRERNGLDLVRQLRRLRTRLRIVVVTDVDSFASAILALRAGADDYLAKPADPGELADALLGRSPALPPVPSIPLGLSRVCWEHVMRIHEQCGRNVRLTALRLGMHRRSLQRILSKRAPSPRAAAPAQGTGEAPVSRFRHLPADATLRQAASPPAGAGGSCSNQMGSMR